MCIDGNRKDDVIFNLSMAIKDVVYLYSEMNGTTFVKAKNNDLTGVMEFEDFEKPLSEIVRDIESVGQRIW